jgi:hypothetical protein
MEDIRPVIMQLEGIARNSENSQERAQAFELVQIARVRSADECLCSDMCIQDTEQSYHDSVDRASPVSVLTEDGRRIVVHIDEPARGAAKYPS